MVSVRAHVSPRPLLSLSPHAGTMGTSHRRAPSPWEPWSSKVQITPVDSGRTAHPVSQIGTRGLGAQFRLICTGSSVHPADLGLVSCTLV